jgi:NAD(P)-dependent dehydrogenase (short-subunit alcohol dehydrogenase family)
MQLRPLRDQVVVLLGASSGIGRASALRFAAEGARVVVAARSEGKLDSLVEEIVASGGRARLSSPRPRWRRTAGSTRGAASPASRCSRPSSTPPTRSSGVSWT